MSAPPEVSPARAPARRVTRRMRGHHVGTVIGVGPDGWLVDYPGNTHGALLARMTVQPDADAFHRAAETQAAALLVFEGERSDRPVVVGLLAPAPAAGATAEPPMPADARPTEAVVDGERVVFTAEREVVLRCGNASIQLLSDGSVRIRGTNVLSRASATNRIRGGSVQIN